MKDMNCDKTMVGGVPIINPADIPRMVSANFMTHPQFIPKTALIKVQTKKVSLFESVTNVVVGYGVALASQIVLFPLFGIHISIKTNLWIGFWFTIISIVRSYLLRRAFNYKSEKTLNRR